MNWFLNSKFILFIFLGQKHTGKFPSRILMDRSDFVVTVTEACGEIKLQALDEVNFVLQLFEVIEWLLNKCIWLVVDPNRDQ